MTSESVGEALRHVRYPGFSRDIVSFGLVKDITCEPGLTVVKIEVATSDPALPEQIFRDCHAALDPLPGIGHARIEIEVKHPPAAGGGPVKSTIPGVKRVIAVALARNGARVGLCDCDLAARNLLLAGSH